MDVTIFLTAQIAVMAFSLLLALVILVHGHRYAVADGGFRLHRSLMVGFLAVLAAHSLSGCFIVRGGALEVYATQPLVLLYAAFAVLTMWGSAAMGRRHHQRLTTWVLLLQIPAVLLVVNALMLSSGHYRPIMASADLLDYQADAPVVFYGRVIFMAMLFVFWLLMLGMFVEQWQHDRSARRARQMDADASFHRHEVRLLCGWVILLTVGIVPFVNNIYPPHIGKDVLWVAALLWTAFVYRRLSALTRERLSGSLLGRLLAERLPVVLALEQGGTTPWQTYMPLNPFFASGNPVLDDIAGALGIGRDELSQYIHQALGTNLVAWVSEQRLLYSASQLEQGGRKISEIAAVCGYNDLPTFTRAFKRQFGMAPSEYRKQGKE